MIDLCIIYTFFICYFQIYRRQDKWRYFILKTLIFQSINRQYTNVLYNYHHAYNNFGTFIIIPLKKETIYICFLYSVFVHVYCGNIGGGLCDLIGDLSFQKSCSLHFFNNIFIYINAPQCWPIGTLNILSTLVKKN